MISLLFDPYCFRIPAFSIINIMLLLHHILPLLNSQLTQLKDELHQLHNNVKSMEAQEEKFTENEEMYEKKVRDLEGKLKEVGFDLVRYTFSPFWLISYSVMCDDLRGKGIINGIPFCCKNREVIVIV